ncbi:hypothetical protein IC608_16470 [Devosia sp. PTR5]|uniref:Uncharacterized protein n=1 Tax=Devosia oryzisoli TaxID=2774138 RepID=A0A927IUU8_9HYPH|nr:hypothetical protein [Devosia oryzisoli]MBD8067066.1 hypothetical protein [Devosia oryzisoli]
MPGRLFIGLALVAMAAPATAFDISSSYAPSADLVPGRYACVSGLDFSSYSWTFDVDAAGSYVVEGLEGGGSLSLAPNGEVAFDGGPFASDDTATTAAMNTTRASDGAPVLIIRYDFGDTVTDDYCARFE